MSREVRDNVAEIRRIISGNRFNPDIVVIASSTGGPEALETLLSKVKADYNKTILIVQHIPANFSESLSRNLSRKASIVVKTAVEGETLKGGVAYIAPGGRHMVLTEGLSIGFSDAPHVNGVKPAADVLFESVAERFEGRKVLAAVLTGMGRDGMAGVKALKVRCNCRCLTQSESSCLVYGMPRAVSEAGLSDQSLELADIADRINDG